MRKLFKVLALATVLLGATSAAQAQVSFGIRIGPPPAPRAYRVPRQPGPDFAWVEGYWYPQGNRYVWHNGYWTRPPFPGAYWVEPYYSGGQYFQGYWENRDRRFNHDHRWDRGRQRDDRRFDDRRDDRRR